MKCFGAIIIDNSQTLLYRLRIPRMLCPVNRSFLRGLRRPARALATGAGDGQNAPAPVPAVVQRTRVGIGRRRQPRRCAHGDQHGAGLADSRPLSRVSSDEYELREFEHMAVVVAAPISKPEATPRLVTPGRARWPMIIGHQSLAGGQRSAISHQPRARAPGVLERVKRSARS